MSKNKDMVVYQTTRQLLSKGKFREAVVRMECQARRAMSRRNHKPVVNGKVKDK